MPDMFEGKKWVVVAVDDDEEIGRKRSLPSSSVDETNTQTSPLPSLTNSVYSTNVDPQKT